MLPHPEIIQASEVGHVLLIDDGKVKLQVTGKGDGYIECEVVVPGKIKDRKGVNTPDSILEISPLTPKDRSDLEYMLKTGVDWVTLSFVQRPEDILEINRLIDEKLPPNAFCPAVMAMIDKPSWFIGDIFKEKLSSSAMVSWPRLAIWESNAHPKLYHHQSLELKWAAEKIAE